MSSRSCPDWPNLLEAAPDLHFKHFTLAEAKLPASVLIAAVDVPLNTVAICADLNRNVFNSGHTDPQVAAALASSHWLDLAEWVANRGA